MNESRINALLSYLSEDPNDAFTLYALALEYLHSAPNKSEEIFEKLLKEKPEYLPTHLLAANHYRSNEMYTKAKEIYNKGIDLARKNNDSFALKELQNALNELLFEDED